MKDFQTLKILDRFESMFVKFGVDYEVMRRILQVKLMMDQRRVPTVFNQSAKKSNKDQNQFIKSLWIYVLFGAFMIPFIVLGENYIFQTSIVFGIFMFLIMTSMISDFSSVLLDIRDKTILSTKPISRKTINMAKTIHVGIYLLFLTGALTLPSLIAGLIKHGILFTIIFLLEIILIDILILVMTALIYFVILKFFDGEKLKDIINYVQIGLSIMLVIGYQLVGRSFEILNIDIVFSPSWWQFFVPPIWFGAPFELILNQQFGGYFIAFSLMALIIPVVAFAVYLKMMPAFEKNLAKLMNHSGNKARPVSTWNRTVMNMFCFSKEEKTFYRFADLMIRNEREFRLKVYPSIGLSLIIPFIFIINELSFSGFGELAKSKWYLSLYFSSIVIPTAVMMLKYSGKYKGAWIYKAAPVSNFGPIYSGTLKAFFVKLYLPIFLMISIVFLFIFGINIIPDLIIMLLSSLLITFICAKLLLRTLPFSDSFDNAGKDAGLKVLPFFLLIGVFFGIHYASLFLPLGAWMYTVILVIINIIVWWKGFS